MTFPFGRTPISISLKLNKDIPVLFITNGLLLNKVNNVENLIKYGTEIKISLQVLDATKHKDARGLNLELDRYVKGVIDFCNKVKNLNHLNITIDLGCNFNEKKINYYVKRILGIQVGDPSVPKDLSDSIEMFAKFYDFPGNSVDFRSYIDVIS